MSKQGYIVIDCIHNIQRSTCKYISTRTKGNKTQNTKEENHNLDICSHPNVLVKCDTVMAQVVSMPKGHTSSKPLYTKSSYQLYVSKLKLNFFKA